LNFAYTTGHLSREFDKRFRPLLIAIGPRGLARALAPRADFERLQVICPELVAHCYDDASLETALSAFIRDVAMEVTGDLGIEWGMVDRPCVPQTYYRSLLKDGIRLTDVSSIVV